MLNNPNAPNGCKRWDRPSLERLRQFAVEGMSVPLAARTLGRTIAATQQRAAREGIFFTRVKSREALAGPRPVHLPRRLWRQSSAGRIAADERLPRRHASATFPINTPARR